MVSLDSADYSLPRRVKLKNGVSAWQVNSRRAFEFRILEEFNFTILASDLVVLGLGHEEKLTFVYRPNGNIKAAPRTLRVYGAQYLGPIISKLMNYAHPQAGSASTAEHKEEAVEKQGSLNTVFGRFNLPN